MSVFKPRIKSICDLILFFIAFILPAIIIILVLFSTIPVYNIFIALGIYICSALYIKYLL